MATQNDQPRKLRVLDLFSGIGGFSLGLERTGGFETVAFCEIDPYCQRVLRKHWPHVPCFGDIRELSRGSIPGRLDAICGGFPCQPVSLAGERLGAEDHRWLWPEYRRLIEEFGVDWVIGENVIGLVGMECDNVLADLEALGYSARAFDIPACAVGAPHERRRIWIVAHSNRVRPQGGEDARGIGGCRPQRQEQFAGLVPSSFWVELSEASLRGEDDGLPTRTHRLRTLGNAVVPQIPEIIGRAILEAERSQCVAA